MKNKFIFSLLLSLLVIVLAIPIPFLYGQTSQATVCLDLVRDAYKKFNTPTPSSQRNQIYYFDYQVKTTLRDSLKYPHYATGAKVFINQQQVRFLSKEMSVYQDATNSLTVLPDRKVIYWGDSNMNLGKELRMKNFSVLQDTLFDLAHVSECKDIQLKNGKAHKQVVLELDEKARKLFPMQTLTFQIDTVQQSIHKIIIDYPEPHKIARIEITYNELNYNYKTDLLDKPVMSLFFNEKQELLPKYKDYKLIDQRKRSKK